MRAKITRTETSIHGTFGRLQYGGFECWTLELPWYQNEPQVSCIPDGEYLVTPWHSRKWPLTYHVNDVPNRSAILIHTGNVAGDRSVGFKSHVLGCILLGKYRGLINKQKAVLSSAVAYNEFRAVALRKAFDLQISWR